jgi:methylenetetrahydrofolate dehydrogenase (NADP+)/methenyltetrahydrofolate cyclohydrolase
LDEKNVDIRDKQVVIVGAGRLVGGPLAKLITERKPATLTVCTKNTKDLHIYTSKADIIVTAAG